MKGIIFVGGIQYSGKSSFCKKLESVDKKFRHIAMDDAYWHLGHNREVFLNIIKKDNRDLFKKIMKLGKKCNVEGKENIMTLFANYMIHEDRYSEFQTLHKRCALLYTGSRISNLDDVVPLMDGLMINHISRKFTYCALKDSLNYKIDLDKLKKLIVFFDIGLEKSLLRYKSNTRQNNPHIEINEKIITETYHSQSLPSKDEFPNLDVLVINNEADIHSSIKYVLDSNFS